ncbi:hypothetical protein DN432_07430 [Lactobacillus reuteri]|uniref:hypothetical protein n=1 Tax=Limosilactobacillus reuteri TaxID=1598 RepID=UPI00128CA955|nr:hypothetical protein [Limosilactobacillus reuteri]MQB93615.1 hypothetical protein [Limosilactobacillus reuteri]
MKISLDKNKLFLISFGTWGLFFLLTQITYYNHIIPKSLWYIVCLISVFLLIIKEYLSLAIEKESINTFFLFGIFFLIFGGYILLKTEGFVFATSIIFIFSARDINFKRILKTFLFFSIFDFLLTYISYILGIIGSMSTIKDGLLRNSIGFTYASFPSQLLFHITCAFFVLKNKNLRNYHLVVFLILNYVIYNVTRTTSPFLLICFLIMLLFMKINLHINIFIDHGFFTKFLSFSYWWSFFILLWLCFWAPSGITFAVDKLVNNRLRLSANGFYNFGVHLFGQKIDFNVLDSLGNYASNYNYIDSSYMNMLVVNGLIFFVIVMFLFTETLIESSKTKLDTLFVVLVIIAIHSMFDPQLLLLWYSPFPLLIGKYFYEKSWNLLLT